MRNLRRAEVPLSSSLNSSFILHPLLLLLLLPMKTFPLCPSPKNFHPSLLSALNLVSPLLLLLLLLRLNLPPLSPPLPPPPSPGLSGSIRSVVRSMAEAEPAALLSALHHNTSLQLTAGLQNAPYAHAGMQERAQTLLRLHQLCRSHTLADARKKKNSQSLQSLSRSKDCTTFWFGMFTNTPTFTARAGFFFFPSFFF